MGSFLQMVRSNNIVQAVLSIALGLLLAFMPETTTLTLMYLLALYFAVTGAASLLAYFRSKGERYRSPGVLATAIFFLVVALVVAVFPQGVAGFFSLVLGILLVVGGVANAVRSFELRTYRGGMWVFGLVVSAVIAVGGVVIIVNPFDTTVTFMLVLGILLIVKGVGDLVIETSLSSAMKNRR
ncbi:MAG: DUF308 domain-containing protein [Gordonibacter sp.]|uniref:HdeD family acid-resistance protein n=1 Tax=Gordonibacter sp. TaxID=1968902 RepID=UPI002FC61DF3